MKRMTADGATRMAARLLALEWYEERYQLSCPFGPDGEIDPVVEEQHIQTWVWAEHNWLAFVDEVDDEDVRQLLCLMSCNGVGAGTWRPRQERQKQ